MPSTNLCCSQCQEFPIATCCFPTQWFLVLLIRYESNFYKLPRIFRTVATLCNQGNFGKSISWKMLVWFAQPCVWAPFCVKQIRESFWKTKQNKSFQLLPSKILSLVSVFMCDDLPSISLAFDWVGTWLKWDTFFLIGCFKAQNSQSQCRYFHCFTNGSLTEIISEIIWINFPLMY